MSQLTIHNDSSSEVTTVSNVFLDQYMLEANGEFVKIYLYLLRVTALADTSFSFSSIADTLNCTEKDILRALKYWQKAGILNLTFDENKVLKNITFLSIKAKENPLADSRKLADATDNSPAQTTISKKAKASASIEAVPLKITFSADKVKQLTENEEVRQLLFIAEQYLGRALTPADTHHILYYYDELHFSVDLIEYLIEYCVSKEHRSMRYIETVALSWAGQNITTVAMAKKETSHYHKQYFPILKAFGIKGRNPIEPEMKYMDTWIKEYGFTIDIISEACTRTILQTNQPNFRYADRILSDWHSKNVKHPTDIEKLDAQHKQKSAGKSENPAKKTSDKAAKNNKFNNYPQREYDTQALSELEKQLLNQ